MYTYRDICLIPVLVSLFESIAFVTPTLMAIVILLMKIGTYIWKMNFTAIFPNCNGRHPCIAAS